MLAALGWGDFQQHALSVTPHGSDEPARIVCQEGAGLWVDTGSRRLRATLAGRLKHSVSTAEGLPAVGDWVLISKLVPGADMAVIRHVLPRKTVLMRRRVGAKAEAQLLAANVNLALVVCALEREPNTKALERAIVVARTGGITPVIVLTKIDLCPSWGEQAEAVRARLALDLVVPVSVVTDQGIDALTKLILPQQTAALIGESGAGKSSLVNRLTRAPAMRVGAVRGDDRKGRHTTTHRELFRLPEGGLLLDGPGVRELGVFADPRAVALAFPDVAALAARCLRETCSHVSEAGCAMQRALADGALDPRRLLDYRTLVAEASELSSSGNRRGTPAAYVRRRRPR